MPHGFTGAAHPHRIRAQAAGDLRPRHDDGAAVVGHEAAVVEGERPSDHPRFGDVLQRDRAAERALLLAEHHGARVELRPIACDHGDVGEIFRAGAEAVEMAHHRMGVLRGCAEQAVGRRHLGGGADLAAPAPAAVTAAAVRPTGLAVAHQRDVDDAGVNGRQRMVDVNLERAAADHGGVQIARPEAQMLRQFARPAGGEDALDVRDGNARLVADVPNGLDVVLQGSHALARQLHRIADDVGFRRPDDGGRVLEVRRHS